MFVVLTQYFQHTLYVSSKQILLTLNQQFNNTVVQRTSVCMTMYMHIQVTRITLQNLSTITTMYSTNTSNQVTMVGELAPTVNTPSDFSSWKNKMEA